MDKIMNFFNFLFHSTLGVGILILAVLIISVIAAAIMEKKTRKTFVDRTPAKGEEDDDWSFFDDEDDE